MTHDAGERGDEPGQVGESWREVGRQFQQLGESLGAAFRAAWHDEQVRQQARSAKDGLEALADEIGHVVREMAASEDVRRAGSGAARSMQQAGEQTIQEIRPHLLEGLRQVNRELQKLIERLERGRVPDSKP
jgi:hypothetical protein